MPVLSTHRISNDLHSGLFQPFPAEDGAIVRLRLPGGQAKLDLLRTLFEIGTAGVGFLHLTSRGDIQLRGLPDPLPDDVVTALRATGLVPSPDHERVRNIMSSPLSGLWARNMPGGQQSAADVRPVVAELDRLLSADPELADLPDDFLFAIDDGRGDVLAEPFDVAYFARGDRLGEVHLAGSDRGLQVSADEAAATMIEVARAFQWLRGYAEPAPLRIRELDEELPGIETHPLPQLEAGPRPAPGALGPHALVGVPLGRLLPDQIDSLGALTDHVILTGWRSIVVPGAAERLEFLAEAGFVVYPDSGWAQITACTGSPACPRANANTQIVAADLVAALDRREFSLPEPVHLVACDRACGAAEGVRQVVLDSNSSAATLAFST